MKIPTLVTLFCCLAFLLSAQIGEESKGANKYYLEAETALLNLEYRKAIKLFERSLKINPDLLAAHRALGICYELVYELEEALEHSNFVKRIDPMFSRAMYFDLGNVHYKIGNYDTALVYFREFEKLQERPVTEYGPQGARELDTEADYLKLLPDNIRACQVSIDSLKFVKIEDIGNIGSTINTKGNEYFPFLTNDQKILFYTKQKHNENDENLYFSESKNGEWRSGDMVNSFNTWGNEGMSTLVRDGKKLFFTACNREEVLGTCDIWQATLDGTEILSTGPLEGFSNSEKWESQAAVSCDGSTIFFASNRPGGLGGTDIWKTVRLPDGTWSDPVNLGPKINTAFDEEAPFVTNDGNILYFSSTGHKSMGEQDIFMSRMSSRGDWGTAINLGPPINTPFRELGFFLSADGKTGYFASDRVGGMGGMDIYRFKLPKELISDPITFVEGFVKDSVISLAVESTVKIKRRTVFPTDENGRFFMCVKAGDTLDLRINHKDYKPYQRKFAIPEWGNRTFFNLDILLNPKFSYIVDIENEKKDTVGPPADMRTSRSYEHTVYFGTNQHEVSPDESLKLDDFIVDIKDKDIQRVEIIGFTDSTGADVYNLRLSERRAKKVALYLLVGSIVVDQIYMEGKGRVEDDKAAEKEKNRKVEVKVYTLE